MNTPAKETGSSPAAVAMEAFFTRERANEGIEFSLDRPDGTPTAHKIRIRGIDSDAFRTASADSKRRLVEMAMNKEAATLSASDHALERIRMLASLVASWTFYDSEGKPLPCTEENIIRFLQNAPQIADQIDRLASKRYLFFQNGSTSSSPSQMQSSS